MPHTNRKKKSPSLATGEKKPASRLVHTKRQNIEDDDGWTHIVDTPRKNQLKIKEGQLLHAGDFERDGVLYVERTIEELRADLEYHTKQWEGGEACTSLKVKLRAEERRAYVQVRDVVCLGLGSLQSVRREGRRSSFTQLAALRSIVASLENEHIRCVFQDPQFTTLDKEFLASLGYTVVDDPAAFAYIGEESLVYAIHCYAQVYGAVAEAKRPAVVIGTDVENFGKFNLSETTENIAKSLQVMVKECEVLEFPQVRHDFSDTKIYWRRKEDVVKAGTEIDTTAKAEDSPKPEESVGEEKDTREVEK